MRPSCFANKISTSSSIVVDLLVAFCVWTDDEVDGVAAIIGGPNAAVVANDEELYK